MDTSAPCQMEMPGNGERSKTVLVSQGVRPCAVSPGPPLPFAVALAFALAAAGLAADRTQTANGTVTKVDAEVATIVVAVADGPETTFVWTDETKISGTLAPGVRVTIRYAAGDDGRTWRCRSPSRAVEGRIC